MIRSLKGKGEVVSYSSNREQGPQNILVFLCLNQSPGSPSGFQGNLTAQANRGQEQHQKSRTRVIIPALHFMLLSEFWKDHARPESRNNFIGLLVLSTLVPGNEPPLAPQRHSRRSTKVFFDVVAGIRSLFYVSIIIVRSVLNVCACDASTIR